MGVVVPGEDSVGLEVDGFLVGAFVCPGEDFVGLEVDGFLVGASDCVPSVGALVVGVMVGASVFLSSQFQ